MLTLDLPFRLRDRDGTVHVEIVPSDPDELGHHLIVPGRDMGPFRGFPSVTGSVSYAGTGPRAWMGWVQVIDRRDRDATVATEIDHVPRFAEGGPFYAFGYLPTLSDSPANPDHPDGDWIADSFLVAIPDIARSAVLVPVAAFTWGYRLRDGRPVELFEPSELAPSAWDLRLPFLESQHPDWTFQPSGTPI